MPNTEIQTGDRKRDGNLKLTSITKNVTNNNARLLYDSGRTYYYTGDNASGNRTYKDAQQ